MVLCQVRSVHLTILVASAGDWTWFEQPTDAWRKKYPYVTKKD